MSKIISGTKFNDKYQHLKFYKFTYTNNKHYGMTYVDGLNIDIKEFSFENNVGLYFFATHQAFHHYQSEHTHVRTVVIPDDAHVIVREKSFKADKFILGPSRHFSECVDLIIDFLRCSTLTSPLVKSSLYDKLSNKCQNLEILGKLSVFSHNMHVKSYVCDDDQLRDIITRYPSIISVIDVSYELLQLALSLNGMLLVHVVNSYQNYKKDLEKYKSFFDVTEFETKLKNLYMIAINQNFEAIQYVQNPTVEMCLSAFSISKNADKHIKSKLSKEVITFAIFKYPELITLPNYLDECDENTIVDYFRQNPEYFKYLPKKFQTEELCKIGLSYDINNYQYIDNKFSYLLGLAF